MEYSNPEIPEGINASQEHPLKEFFWLSASVLVAGLALILIAVLLADTLSDRIPFSVEQRMTAKHFAGKAGPPELDAYLNQLAARIATVEGLPEGMSVRVHYSDAGVVNAFATLGGNIVLFRGLLEKLPNENALAMLLAHEIAHVKHRDPIRGIGRAVVIGLSLSMLSTDAGDAVLDRALSQGATLTILKYSREQERAADDAALDALVALYGHVEGAAALFEVLKNEHPGAPSLEFFSSHPLTSDRIKHIANAYPRHAEERRVTELPEGFATWLTTKQDTKAAGAKEL